jgi:hypothetical protein
MRAAFPSKKTLPVKIFAVAELLFAPVSRLPSVPVCKFESHPRIILLAVRKANSRLRAASSMSLKRSPAGIVLSVCNSRDPVSHACSAPNPPRSCLGRSSPFLLRPSPRTRPFSLSVCPGRRKFFPASLGLRCVILGCFQLPKIYDLHWLTLDFRLPLLDQLLVGIPLGNSSLLCRQLQSFLAI